MISLRESLKGIGEPRSGRDIPSFPSGFHSSPRSLRQAMKAMTSPNIDKWKKSIISGEFANQDWTEECQGITTDGQYWYISSNNASKRGIYKFTLNFEFKGYSEYPSHLGNHIGSIDFYDGKIYGALEPIPRIAIFDTSPAFLGYADLKKGNLPELPQFKVPWCALNPWNGYLYSSVDDGVNIIHAYDPNDNFNYKKSLVLEGGVFSGISGGVFSRNGHLYLSLDDLKDTQEIRAFNVLNGAFLGSLKLDHDDELEGLTILPIDVSGNSVHVHVVLLDNDFPSKDDVHILHFTVPDPNTL